MSKSMKRLTAFVTIIVLVLSMAGCAKPAEAPAAAPSGGTDANPAEAPKPVEKTKVRVMSWWNFADSKPLQQLKAGFEAKNPDYELVFEQIPTKYADKVLAVVAGGGDQVPDVMMLAMDRIPQFAKAGAIQPLDSLMSEDYKKSLYPVVFEAVKFDGKVYAAPRDITSFVMFCNKKLFDEANVPLPQDGWTWEDFLNTAKKLTKFEGGNAVQWGYYFPKYHDTVFTWLIQNGAAYTTPDGKEGTLSKPEGKAALKFLQDLILKHKVCPTETEAKQFGTDSSAAFIAGKVAMQIGGLSMSVALDNNNIDYVMVPLPKGKKQASTAFVNAWTIPKGAKNPEASWKVIEYFSSKEGQQIVLDTKMGLPASKDVDVSGFLQSRPDNKALVDALAYSIPFQTFENSAKYYDLVKNNLDLVWLGEKSVDAATEEIDKNAKAVLAGQ